MKSPAHPTPRGDSLLLRVFPVVLAALVLSLLSPRSVARAPAPSPLASGHAAGVSGAAAPPAKWGHLPMRFEENAGQVDDQVRFVARGGGTTLFLTDEGATLTLHPPGAARSAQGPGSPRRLPHELARPAVEAPPRPDTVLRMTVAGGRRVSPRAEQKLITISNYFIGNDHSKWRTDIPNFGRVVYPGVLDGVDLVYHGEEGQLEYDFVVAPGADSGAIALDVAGAQELSLTDVGDLAIRTEHGVLVQPRPRVYQRGRRGETEEIAAGYRLIGERGVGFVVAAYDRRRELVIDPVLEYSSGFGPRVYMDGGVAVDGSRSAYVVGCSDRGGLATGSPKSTFVAKLTPSGDALIYGTYFGGASGGDCATDLATDATGSAYFTGRATSTDLPLQAPIQPTKASTTPFGGDAFVAKLSPLGNALVYSTYLGGTGEDYATGIAVDPAGAAYVTGTTGSTNFPTQNAFQAASAGGDDIFLAKLSPAGGSLVFSTYLGGSGGDSGASVAVDRLGSAYVVGATTSPNFPTQFALQAANAGGPAGLDTDAFVTKFSAAGTALVYSTYLGGTGFDGTTSVAVDAAGSAHVAGSTGSTDFPTRNALQAVYGGPPPTPSTSEGDAFVAKLTPTGGALVYSTYFGGSQGDYGGGIAIDNAGNAYLSGGTRSSDLPTINAFAVFAGRLPGSDAFVAKLTPTGASLLYSTYVGISGWGGWNIAVDSAGSAYLVGGTTQLPPLFSFLAPFDPRGAGEISEFGVGFIAKLSVPSPTLTPPTSAVAPGGTVTFAATDGTGPTYTFAFETNASGGTLDPVTGVYVAGPTGGVTDVVVVVDSQGGTATASVTVSSPVADAGPDATIVDASADAAPVLDAGDAAARDASPTADASSPVRSPAPSGDASTAAIPTGDSFGGGGCGCRTSGAPASGGAAGLGVLGVLALVARRRSRLEQDSRSDKRHS